MSQSRTEAGQSIEDILASIRRIIAEGEREAQDPGGPPVRSEPGDSSRPATPEAAEEAAQAGVLVLTEMVQDDGSVVSLPSTPAASAPPEAPPEPDDAAVESLLRKTLLAEMPPSAAASISFTTTVETAAVSVEPTVAPSPPPAPAAKPSAPAESAVKPKPADAVPDKLPAWLSPTPPPPKEERTPVSSEGLKKPELVSEEALAASTAALAQLAQSVTRTREPAPGSSKTVEEVVREAVEPMLKQWLDQHLPRIVERMVREAIDRVVRRVE